VLLLASRFIIRDLFEAGPNLLLLSLTWSAVYLWLKRHDALAGMCLGLAAALKCTPAILLTLVCWRLLRTGMPNSLLQSCSECAGMLVLGLLLSPITWTQHCVAVIPALYLLVRRALVDSRLDWPTVAVLGYYLIFVVLLNRSFLGRDLTIRLYSLGAITWGLVALAALMLRRRTGLDLAYSEEAVSHPGSGRLTGM